MNRIPKVSIIIPVLNEVKHIEKCITDLQLLQDSEHEVIFVDGGSVDDTVKLISQHSWCSIVTSVKGRANQMNTGAGHANGEVLLFLHVDTILPFDAIELIIKSFNLSNKSQSKKWGRFDVRLSGTQRIFRIIEVMMNWRSRLTSVATGDQAIFINRELFEQVGAYPELALMEDIAMSKKLRQITKPVCLKQTVKTSSRRWEEKGILKTVLLMWQLRFLYFIGVSAEQLVKRYN